MKQIKFNLLIGMALCVSLLSAENTPQDIDGKKMWGYLMQITDTDYIPHITAENDSGYITLESGIAEYDAIYAKYLITDFYQYAPTAKTEKLRQIYVLVCDSGQTNLGAELAANYSTVIPMIEIFYSTPELTATSHLKSSPKIAQKGSNLFLGDNSKNRKINFFNLSGYLVYSTETYDNEINPSGFLLQKGIFIYQIMENKIKTTGLYHNL